MKKIILLFFTFLGICSCFAQDRSQNIDSIMVTQKQVTNILPLKSDTIRVKEKALVRIYPNPAKNKVEIDIIGFEPGYIKVQLMNNSGKIMKEEKRLILTGNETIVFMFAEIPGIYYLFMKQGTKSIKNKLIIQ